MIERAVIMSKDRTLQVDVTGPSTVSPEPVTLDEVQRKHIVDVLERTHWRIRGNGGTAEILGLKPSTLESRMARFGIKRPG